MSDWQIVTQVSRRRRREQSWERSDNQQAASPVAEILEQLQLSVSKQEIARTISPIRLSLWVLFGCSSQTIEALVRKSFGGRFEQN